jgi:hypothetical protein
MSNRTTRRILTLGAVAAMAVGGGVAPTAFARHGADDPPGHDAGDDHGGQRVKPRAHTSRHGADDRPGHRRHGADDGPGHRRHGADDGPNHR